MINKKYYAERDIEEQGQHYANHINAMTAESLHCKSSIAAELAHRDITIEQLRAEIDRLITEVPQLLRNERAQVAHECAEIAEKQSKYLSCSKDGHGISTAIRKAFALKSKASTL